jgi:hypothetical protein
MIRESRQELAVTEAPPGPECDQALAVEIGAARAGWQCKRGGAIRLVYAQGDGRPWFVLSDSKTSMRKGSLWPNASNRSRNGSQ